MPAAGQRRKNALTYTQKVEERNRRKSESRSTSQKDLAMWAKTKFRPDAPPSQAVIAKLFSKSSSVAVERIVMAKRGRRGKIPEVRNQHAAKVCVNGEMINMQGLRI